MSVVVYYETPVGMGEVDLDDVEHVNGKHWDHQLQMLTWLEADTKVWIPYSRIWKVVSS